MLGGEPRTRADLSFESKWDGACVAERDLDDIAGLHGDLGGHVMARQAGGEIEPGGVGGFVSGEDCTIIKFFDSDGRCADPSDAGDFDLGDQVGGVWGFV